jgi:hypothetical protein
VEVVTPRTNAAAIAAAENFLAAISLPEPFSLEMAATAGARWFLLRAGTGAMRRHLEEQLGAAYPQADLRRLDAGRIPGLDPARRAQDERVAACALVLRGPPYLPLRTFADVDVAADRAAHAAQADPVLGILAALGSVPDGWRALAQLVLRPAPDDWGRPYARLAVEHPLAPEQASRRGAAASGPDPAMLLVAAGLGAGAIGLQAYGWYHAGDWLRLSLLAAVAVLGVPLALWGLARLRAWRERPVYDMRLVGEKLGRIAYLAQLRLAVFAPAGTAGGEVEARLSHLAAAYRQYSLATGNGLVPRPLLLPPADRAGADTLCSLAPLRHRTRLRFASLSPAAPVLNTRELAGLWHLPQARADVPLVERTSARQRLPLPVDVAEGCRIGESVQRGRAVPVCLPEELLRRHLLLVAKTRRGKSTLLLRLFRHLLETPPVPGELGRRPCVVLVDPHRDLARAALGLVPADRRDGAVFLDVSDPARPFGLNLLDTGLFRDRDKAVANALVIFRREFDAFWGPRMEIAFRVALMALYEANERICEADPGGRARQLTVLDVPALLAEPPFQRRVLGLVRDPVITDWFDGFLRQRDRRQQAEIISPVQTKVHRVAASRAARWIVGQPRSTIDPAAWVRDGAVVVVNTAKGTVGEGTAALIGATLLNLVALVVAEQAALDPADRGRVTLLVDEFHTMPGADYEAILSELAKYGANLVLATQSLARLEALDRQHGRGLRPVLFSNLDGLFAFHTSAEDARYLVRELGGGIEEDDLCELGEYRCYARLSARGERLPVFSVRLDPPPPSDPAQAADLAAASAARHGRPVAEVEHDLDLARERIAEARRVASTASAGEKATGVAKDAPTPDASASGATTSDPTLDPPSADRPDPATPSASPAGKDGAVQNPAGKGAPRPAPIRSRNRRGRPKKTTVTGHAPPEGSRETQLVLGGTFGEEARLPGHTLDVLLDGTSALADRGTDDAEFLERDDWDDASEDGGADEDGTG